MRAFSAVAELLVRIYYARRFSGCSLFSYCLSVPLSSGGLILLRVTVSVFKRTLHTGISHRTVYAMALYLLAIVCPPACWLAGWSLVGLYTAAD